MKVRVTIYDIYDVIYDEVLEDSEDFASILTEQCSASCLNDVSYETMLEADYWDDVYDFIFHEGNKSGAERFWLNSDGENLFSITLC
ncbi:MAG: hypothetical protein HUK07_07170 [Bacteroidaceae bacterium]|nr:hypothetical protein [Bacteroidaceae bacterium]